MSISSQKPFVHLQRLYRNIISTDDSYYRMISLLLIRGFFWPGTETYVDQNIEEPGQCISCKKSPTIAAELFNITSTTLMDLICIDYLSLEHSKECYKNK